MTLPTGIATGQVTVSNAIAADGTRGSGTVELRPAVSVTGHDTIITTTAVTFTVTDGTAAAKTVAATDDPGLLPLGWRYEVREYINGEYRPPYFIDVPTGSVVDLSTAPRLETVPAVWRVPRTVAGIGPNTTGDIPAADLQAVLDVSSGGAPTVHSHAQADVTNLTAALAEKVDTTDPRLSDARTPTAHTHTIAQVVGLQDALDGMGTNGHSSTAAVDRWGCLAVTFPPHSVNPVEPQMLRMAPGRLYAYWLPLSVGTTVSAVRVPIGEEVSAPGGLWFTVYQDDGALLGGTGDVSAAFSVGGQSWHTADLTTPSTTTGSGVWVTALSTVDGASSAQLVFCDVTAPEVPLFLFDGKALRVEGLNNPPATFTPGAGVAYYDALIGVA